MPRKSKNSSKQWYSRYGLSRHGQSFSQYVKHSRENVETDKIEKENLLLFYMVNMADRNEEQKELDFCFTNSFIANYFRKFSIKWHTDETSVYITRLAEKDLIHVSYNNTIYQPRRPKPYPEYLQHGTSIGVNKHIDTTTDHVRTITLNMNKILPLLSIIDLNDPEYQKLSPKSSERRIVKKRPFTCKKGFKEKSEEILERANLFDKRVQKSNCYIKSVDNVWKRFIKNVSNNYYHSKALIEDIAIYTNRDREKARIEANKRAKIIVDDDTGEVLDPIDKMVQAASTKYKKSLMPDIMDGVECL